MRVHSVAMILNIGILSLGLGFLQGCASAPQKTALSSALAQEMEGAPDWARNCNNYWKNKNERQPCAVGSLGGTANISLAREGAIGRGRTELARTLQFKVKAMLKDYQATTTGGAEFGKAAADEQHVEDVAKNITTMTLNGTEMLDSWISSSGTFWVIVAMDTEKFKDSVSKMGTLSEAVRRAVVSRANKAFEDLDEEVERDHAQ